MILFIYSVYMFFFEIFSKLYVMSSVVKLKIFIFTVINGYHKTRNRRIEFYFSNEYFILVYNKTILKTINTKSVFDEM